MPGRGHAGRGGAAGVGSPAMHGAMQGCRTAACGLPPAGGADAGPAAGDADGAPGAAAPGRSREGAASAPARADRAAGGPVPHFQAPGRGRARRRRSFLRPWMVIVAIILAASIAGVIIAMSGPNVSVQHGK